MAGLSEARIRPLLPPEVERQLGAIDVFASIDSTNTYLLERPAPAPGSVDVAIAEHQTAGRGRGHRRWHSPPGGGLWLSAGYAFVAAPENLSALTLAVGTEVARALGRIGVADIALKWPNDLIVDDRKLGGILVDSSTARGAGTTVVCGLGINTDLTAAAEAIIESGDDGRSLPPIDLEAVLRPVPPMQELAATMIECLASTFDRYEHDGFAAFAADWSAFDWLRGRRVVVEQGPQIRQGIAAGVAATGALVLQDGETTHHVVSGTVRLSDEAEAVI